MTGTEAALAARKYANAYKYIYVGNCETRSQSQLKM